jgi:predicted AAA+ superfamily ATPase
MITRRQWVHVIEEAWEERPIVWLSGVRRVGKTCLSQSLANIAYFDCELPRVRQMMVDPPPRAARRSG